MEVTWPSHGKLKKKFAAIGPYFRGEQSDEQRYLFDCLAVCVDPEPEPEQRQFYGWWLELVVVDESFEYHYHYGLFDLEGVWQEQNPPQADAPAVRESLDAFYAKLVEQLELMDLRLQASDSLAPERVLPAA